MLVTEFADGGRHEAIGKEVMRALIVPPIALSLSLVGAMVHLCKFANFLACFFTPLSRLRAPTITLAGALLALVSMAIPNVVTQWEVYRYPEKQTTEDFGWPTAASMSWVIRTQPFVYPIGETFRRQLLMGVEFGHADR